MDDIDTISLPSNYAPVHITASEIADIYDERALQLERAHDEIMEAVRRLSFRKETRKSPRRSKRKQKPVEEPVQQSAPQPSVRDMVREELRAALQHLVAV